MTPATRAQREPGDPPRRDAEVYVTLTGEALDVATAVAAVGHPECGGIGLFAGAVRNHHAGERVTGLDYEAWDDEARRAMRRVAEEVLVVHPGVRRVYVAHRTGPLDVGEVSVVTAASAPHRDEAIAAAQALIDGVKEAAPIWKRERLADGGERWPGSDDVPV